MSGPCAAASPNPEAAHVTRFPRFPFPHSPSPRAMLIAALRRLADGVDKTDHRIRRLEEKMMTNFEALNQVTADLGTAIDDAVARIDADFQALKDQLNSGADQATVDEAVAAVQSSVDRLKAIDPNPDNPAAAPVGDAFPEPTPGQ